MRKTLIIFAAIVFTADYILRGAERRLSERMDRMGSQLEQRLTQLEGDVAGFNEATNQIAVQLQQDQATIVDLRQQLAAASQGQTDLAALDDRLAKLHESLSGKVTQLQQLGAPSPVTDQPPANPPVTDQTNPPVTDQTNPPADQPPTVDQPVTDQTNPPATNQPPTVDQPADQLPKEQPPNEPTVVA